MAKNSMYLYGKNPVYERLKTNPKSIRKIYLQDNFNAPYIIELIKQKGISVKYVSERELNRIKRADRVQGIVAEVDKFQYTDIHELLDRPDSEKLSLIFLDNINDPHNLGSIIRIAACFGGFAIIIPSRSSCEVTDAVLHVASGGENFVPVCIVNNLSNAIIEAKKSGYWIVGAAIEGGEEISKVKLPFPLCLVLGSEGTGIRHGIDKQIDLGVTIPMRGAALSFNVAMAAAIFCYEIAKNKLKM